MPARITPAPGQTVKETTLTEILPAGDAQGAGRKEHPEFWPWMESIDDNYSTLHKVKTYLHRLIDPEGAARKPNLEAIDVFESPITQSYIIRTFGGGHYRLMTHVDGQLRYDELFRVAGKPKVVDGERAAPSGHAMPQTELGLLAQALQRQSELLEKIITNNSNRPIVDDGLRSALTLQGDVFRTGVDTLRNTLAAPAAAAPAVNPMDEITKQFMVAAISKMMNPADPIEAFAKMAAALKNVMPDGGGGNTSWGVEAIRAIGSALPQIAQAVTAASYAQAPRAPMHPNAGRTIDVAPQPPPMRANADDRRGEVVQMPASSSLSALTPATAENPNPAVQPPHPAAPPQGGEQMAPNLEWLEAKVVDLINNPELTPEQAASEAASFLQTAAPHILPQLTNETSLRWLFANRAILKQVQSPERQERFIVAFLKLYADPVAAPAAPADTLLLTPEPPPA